MGTGTIQSKNPTLRKHINEGLLALTLTAAVDLQEGQEVNLSANLTVTKRTVGTTYPLGFVKVGGLAGKKISVVSNISSDLYAIATGGNLGFGTFVKPNGVLDADGVRPQYVAAASGDFALGIVLSGANSGSEIIVGMLHAPNKLP